MTINDKRPEGDPGYMPPATRSVDDVADGPSAGRSGETCRVAIIGAGRVGGAMAAYGEALGHEALAFGRAQLKSDGAVPFIASAHRVALAVPDDAIADMIAWVRPHLAPDAGLFHFSGAHLFRGVPGYHPLYSFPKSPLAPAQTARIAIAVEPDAPAFSDMLPGAGNPVFSVPTDQRAFYHALAVLSGNYAAFIWNDVARAFEEALGGDAARVLTPYLAGIVERFAEAPTGSMTGPLARGDRETIAANLAALERDPSLHALYQHFMASARPDLATMIGSQTAGGRGDGPNDDDGRDHC